MDVDNLKRKLRQLKKVEDKIRFKHISDPAIKKYVWDEYFSTKSIYDLTVKYPIWKLLKLDKQALKEIFEEYFYRVYFHMYSGVCQVSCRISFSLHTCSPDLPLTLSFCLHGYGP